MRSWAWRSRPQVRGRDPAMRTVAAGSNGWTRYGQKHAWGRVYGVFRAIQMAPTFVLASRGKKKGMAGFLFPVLCLPLSSTGSSSETPVTLMEPLWALVDGGQVFAGIAWESNGWQHIGTDAFFCTFLALSPLLHHSTATRWGKKVKPRNHTTSCDPTEPDRSLAGVAGDERCKGMKYMTQTKEKASSSPWQKYRMMGKPVEGGGTGANH